MSDGGAHSLFLVYSYNPHDPDFNGSWVFEAYFFQVQRNASPNWAHWSTMDMAMHMLLFCPSWAAERPLFERLRLDIFDRIYSFIVMYSAACWTHLRGFLQGRHAQEEAGQVRVSGLEEEKGFLSSDWWQPCVKMYV